MSEWNYYADKIIYNAKIYTVDLTINEIQSGKTNFPIIENGFVAIKDSKIIGIGNGTGKDFCGTKTDLIDANGATLIPGLMDSHMHALFAGIALRAVPLENCTSLQDMLNKIKARAENENNSDWIIGSAWNELSWSDEQLPTATLLDTVSYSHPIAAKRICGHVLVANSKSMELAGITKTTPDPKGGRIGRNPDGTPMVCSTNRQPFP